MNRKAKKYHGGINSSLGVDYEIRYAIKKLVNMLLPNNAGIKTISVYRQKKEHVDDVIEELSDNRIIYHQCKIFVDLPKTDKNKDKQDKDLWIDFFSQFHENSNCSLVLVTQNKDRGYEDLTNLARHHDGFDDFKSDLNTDPYHGEAKKRYNYLLSLIDEQNKEVFIFSFLKELRIESSDKFYTKEDCLKELKRSFSEIDAENIFNAFHEKLNSDWMGKKITKDTLTKELLRLKIDTSSITFEASTDVSRVPQKTHTHLLADPDAPFEKKLDYIFQIINEDKEIKAKDVSKSLQLIASDSTLSWHFLKNLKDESWFPKIKNNIIEVVSESTTDSAAKFQLLAFLEKCTGKYSDESLSTIQKIEENTSSYQVLTALLRTIRTFKPKSEDAIKTLWAVVKSLSEHQHPWVRREIPKTLLAFIEIGEKEAFDLLDKIFSYTPPPQDVTQGSPTLALTFQGRDNENGVFEEAATVLSELLSEEKYSEKAHEFARKIEKTIIEREGKLRETEMGVRLDYSSIWLSNKSFEGDLEHNYDKKERIALEIEKSLDELSKKSSKEATNLLKKLLEEQYEIFYLISIEIISRHVDKFKSLARSIILNPSLWKVYNLRDYYLQTLTHTYFSILESENDIADFFNLVKSMEEDDEKKTWYLQQSMLVSIPEKKRGKHIVAKLDEVSTSLKVKPGISKPFEITTWSSIRPDITVEELETKSLTELVKIIQDSSEGKRAASYDTAPIFAQLIVKKPDLIVPLLQEIKKVKTAPDFAGEMIHSYRKAFPEKIIEILSFVDLLKTEDGWAKIELSRYLNELCRKAEIKDYDDDVIEIIRNALLTLTNDKHPSSDETIKSTPTRPEDAITRGINSVRGIATEALVAFCHYFPSDSIATERVKQLAKDSTNAVKATLIYYLRYLIADNLDLCDTVIENFKGVRDSEIDFALIHFFANLKCEQFIERIDFVKLLFNNPDEKINEDLGELIAYKFIHGCDVKSLLEEVVKGRKGTKNSIRSVAFVFESELSNFIGKDNGEEIAVYLRKLLSPSNDLEVVERASFVFRRGDIDSDDFEFFDKNGLMEELAKNSLNIPAQAHLVEYLHENIAENKNVERSLEILNNQLENCEGILSDHLVVRKFSEIITTLIGKKSPTKITALVSKIFNAGLERGWDEFYAIYFDQRNKNG